MFRVVYSGVVWRVVVLTRPLTRELSLGLLCKHVDRKVESTIFGDYTTGSPNTVHLMGTSAASRCGLWERPRHTRFFGNEQILTTRRGLGNSFGPSCSEFAPEQDGTKVSREHVALSRSVPFKKIINVASSGPGQISEKTAKNH